MTEVTSGPLRSVVFVREGNRREGSNQAHRENVSAVPHLHLLDSKVEERRLAREGTSTVREAA